MRKRTWCGEKNKIMEITTDGDSGGEVDASVFQKVFIPSMPCITQKKQL